MADHNVTLNYTASSNPQSGAEFAPDQNPIRVHAGETIGFRLGTGPPDAKLRLTFADPALFSTADPAFYSTGRFNDGDGNVTVVAPPVSRTTYRCELLVDGVVTASSREDAGGEVVPDGK
jgi:hypothetical protein